MWYTIIEIFSYLVFAALLGLYLGWLIRGWRGDDRSTQLLKEKLSACESSCKELKAALKVAEAETVPLPVADQEPQESKQAETSSGKEPAAASTSSESNELYGKPAGSPVEQKDKKSSKKAAATGKEDQAAKMRVKRLVERASGELDAGEGQLDQKALRKQMKELVRRVSREQKPQVDNLKKIYGIGPKFEKLLNGFGITSYQQIARLTAKDLKLVAMAIDAFPDRVERENWVEGAVEAYREKYGSAPD